MLFGDGPLLIVAGAGTGKTTTLACRVGHLVERGVRPERILLLTFTRRAAREMLSRAAARDRANARPSGLGRHVPRGGQPAAAPPRPGARPSPDFTVLDQSDAADMMNLIRDELGLATRRTPVPAQGDARVDLLADGQRPREAPRRVEALPVVRRRADGIREVFQAYTTRKRDQNVLDYDDLLLFWNSAARPRRQTRDALARVRPRARRRVPGHERAAGRDPGGHAACGPPRTSRSSATTRSRSTRSGRRRSGTSSTSRPVRRRRRDPLEQNYRSIRADPRGVERRHGAAPERHQEPLVHAGREREADAPHLPGRGRAVRLRLPERARSTSRRASTCCSRRCLSAPRTTPTCSRWNWPGGTSRS